MSGPTAILSLRGVNAAYRPGGPQVLSEVSLDFSPGEVVGLLGPNGSGKSSLLLALCGLLRPLSGQVFLAGQDLSAFSLKSRARQIALLPQKPELPPDLSAFELTLLGRYPWLEFLRGYTKADRQRALDCLAQAQALELTERRVRELSGGELQRVLAAKVLAQDTSILLLDEPGSGLDAGHAVALFSLMRRQAMERNTLVIAAVHDLNLAALFCDRLVFMRQSLVLADGRVEDLFKQDLLQNLYNVKLSMVEHPVLKKPQALSNG